MEGSITSSSSSSAQVVVSSVLGGVVANSMDSTSLGGAKELMTTNNVDMDTNNGKDEPVQKVIELQIDTESSSSSEDDDDKMDITDNSGLLEELIKSLAKSKPKPKVVVEWQCINPECHVSSKSELITAENFDCTFFGLNYKENEKKNKNKKRKICKNCKIRVEQSSVSMSKRLKRGEKFFTNDPFPLPKDMVILDDSDEELVSDSSSDSEFEVDITDYEGQSPQDKLQAMITEAMDTFKIKDQMDDAIKSVSSRLDAHDETIKETDKMFDDLEKEVNALRAELYRPFKHKLEHLEPKDLDQPQNIQNRVIVLSKPFKQPTTGLASRTNNTIPAGGDIKSIETVQNRAMPSNIPPTSEKTLERPMLKVDDQAYAMRGSILNVWKTGKVVEVDSSKSEPMFRIKFEVKDAKGNVKGTQSKSLSRKHLAYYLPASVRLPVGTRVIAVYREVNNDPGHSIISADYYSGIVAEPPKVMNKYRYLIFFDDGYASYIPHHDVRVVTMQSADVWEDVHQNSREFIKKYLMQYPERPMVRLSVGQVVRTELEGKWWLTQVQEVDASLVRLQFKSDGRVESVYRGSTRLGPLFMELQQQRAKKDQPGGNIVRRTRRDGGPYVEYTRQTDTTGEELPQSTGGDTTKRAVARKSTGARRQQLDHQGQAAPKDNFESKGEMIKPDIEMVEGKLFEKHQCGIKCLEEKQYQYVEKEHKTINPLTIPIVLGWKRQLTKHKNQGRRTIYYISPCGRRLRNLEEVHRYLRVTQSKLEIDFFNYEWYVHVMNEFKPERELCKIEDVSYGKENVPVSCVNSLDNNFPEYVEYSCVRLPQKDVEVNTDTNFMVCCDCTDDCQDKANCSCCQLTTQSTMANPDGVPEHNVGYVFRRLQQQVPTGIFECNSKCKCKQTCLNRVAQNPLRAKLQVFKTETRGWGIRTLCDIPQGSFICIYVGNLYSNSESNTVGQNYGDEYFAELDLIETLERNKEGYESDYEDLSDCEVLSTFDENEASPASTEDDDDAQCDQLDKEDRALVLPGIQPTGTALDRKMRSRAKKKMNASYAEGDGSEDDNNSEDKSEDKRRELKGFGPTSQQNSKPKDSTEKKEKYVSTRKLFGKEEEVHVMDAKAKGNIGRYLNHSCNPNVFVQNCFVDTHDLRFPWLAFFSSTYIKAGQELCWDYAYVVDQVEGKEIFCGCGADNCRGRLL